MFISRSPAVLGREVHFNLGFHFIYLFPIVFLSQGPDTLNCELLHHLLISSYHAEQTQLRTLCVLFFSEESAQESEDYWFISSRLFLLLFLLWGSGKRDDVPPSWFICFFAVPSKFVIAVFALSSCLSLLVPSWVPLVIKQIKPTWQVKNEKAIVVDALETGVLTVSPLPTSLSGCVVFAPVLLEMPRLLFTSSPE